MLKMATLGNISLVFLGLMTGLVRCEISSCYKVGPAPEYSRMFYSSHSEVDQSWINSTVLDLVQPVPDYEECQLLCQVRKSTLHWIVLIITCLEDTVGCEAWTWTDEVNQDVTNHCWMFSHIGELTAYGDCVREGSESSIFSHQLRIIFSLKS